jgi:hypothetical protein
VTEPPLPPIDGKDLRAFPDELPADELNTKIDESFVPLAVVKLPTSAKEFDAWQAATLAELRRVSFAGHRRPVAELVDPQGAFAGDKPGKGYWVTSEQADPQSAASSRRSAEVLCAWSYQPAKGKSKAIWMIVIGPDESLDKTPDWAAKMVGDAGVLRVAPRGCGPLAWQDKPPFYIQRSMALLGRTVDSGRVADVLALTEFTHYVASDRVWKIAGRGRSGVIAAYAAALAPQHCIDEITVVDPPVSHRDGPIFLNVLRVVDVPQALGLLAPRTLTIQSSDGEAFRPTQAIYEVARARVQIR